MHNYICMPTYESPPRDKHVNPRSHPPIQPRSNAAAHTPLAAGGAAVVMKVLSLSLRPQGW